MEKKINIEYILMHATYQMIAGIAFGFGVYMLMQRGYSSSEAGLCLSLASALNFCVSPFLSNFLDNSKKVTPFDVSVIAAIIVGGLYLCNYFCVNKSLVLSIVFIVGMGVYMCIEPIINALSSEFSNNGLKIEFSTARAIGSFSYASVCAIFGILTANNPYSCVLIGGIGFSLALFITCIFIRKDYYSIKKVDTKKEKVESISFKEFIVNNKLFIGMCVCLVGLMAGYTCCDNFMLLVCENVGGGSDDMGTILAFKAFVESVSMLLFSRYSKKFKLNSILMFASVGFCAKSIGIYLAPSVLFIYVVQILQGISFAVIFPGMVEFVYRNMSDKEAVRGNALFTMTIGAGSIISSITGGYIADVISVNAMEFFSVCITIVAAIGFIVCLIKKNKEDNEKVSI